MPERILVVDDDPAILEVLQLVLEDEGYEVVTNDGTNINEYLEHPFDLALLDIWMRGTDGRIIARQIRAHNHPTKILLMSAHSDLAQSAKETNVDGFIAKPFELDELVEMVNNYVKS
jgi:CheY-like chemotaxis protein